MTVGILLCTQLCRVTTCTARHCVWSNSYFDYFEYSARKKILHALVKRNLKVMNFIQMNGGRI